MVQWLRLCLPRQRVSIQSLVKEQGSHMPRRQKTKYKTEQYFNKLIKTLKWSTKKSLKSTKLGKVLGDAGVFLELMFRYSD